MCNVRKKPHVKVEKSLDKLYCWREAQCKTATAGQKGKIPWLRKPPLTIQGGPSGRRMQFVDIKS